MPLSPASSRKPLRGNAVTVPCETVQPGAANSRVRSPRCSSTRSAAISRRFASCAGNVANSPRRFLVAASSKPCSTTASPASRRAASHSTVGASPIKPVTALDPRRHQERHRHVAPFELRAEHVDIGQCAVADPGDRDDQLSSHMCSVATSDVRTVADTLTAAVFQLSRQDRFYGGDHLGRVGNRARPEPVRPPVHPARAGTSRSSTARRPPRRRRPASW